MKQHGMLYKAEMVRAIMRDVDPKTQTRRPITFSNSICTPRVRRDEWSELRWGEAELRPEMQLIKPRIEDCIAMPCWRVPFRDITVKVYPRIQPGDVIWVRETWSAPHKYDHLPPRLIDKDARLHYAASENLGGMIKRSSMLMPRWASRIDLKVLQMRSERIQDISGEDARAEGIDFSEWEGKNTVMPSPRVLFMILWDSINVSRGYAWADNHPVWIHGFERVKV